MMKLKELYSDIAGHYDGAFDGLNALGININAFIYTLFIGVYSISNTSDKYYITMTEETLKSIPYEGYIERKAWKSLVYS